MKTARFLVQTFVLLCCICYTVSKELDERDRQAILGAFNACASIATAISKMDPTGTVGIVFQVVAVVFQVASIITQIVFSFQKIDSPEIKLMKKEFTNLNNRLSAFSAEFREVEKLIDWSSTQITFSKYEQSITVMSNEIKYLTEADVTEENKEKVKQTFIQKYEDQFKNAPNKLLQAIVGADHLFSTKLQDAARKFTDNHRYKVQDFFVGLTQLLIQGIQVEATYLQIKYNNNAMSEYMKRYWESQMNMFQQIFRDTDRAIESMYFDQLKIDVDQFTQRNMKLNNQEFTGAIYNYLTDKYRWRAWFIIVYGEVSGFDNHAINYCESVVNFRSYGRNMAISSIDTHSSAYTNPGQLEKSSRDLKSVESVTFWWGDKALQLLNKIKESAGMNTYCWPHRMIAVVCWGCNVWYIGDENHYRYEKVCVKNCNDAACWGPSWPCFNTFTFG